MVVATQRRPRLLLLTPRWPYPVNGGDRLRIWQLANQASQRYDITLLSLCQTQAEMNGPPPDDGVFKSVHRVLLPRWMSWWRMGAALISGRQPLQIAYYRSTRFMAQVQALLPEHDLLWCHLARMAPYAEGAHCPAWLEMTDAISLTMRRAAQVHAPWSPVRQLFRLEASRMADFEAAMVNRFDLITLISAVDRQAILAAVTSPSSTSPSHVVVAPNGVAAPRDTLVDAAQRPPAVAFLGRMDSLANRDALLAFVRDVWPQILSRMPSARLHVVGYAPRALAQQLNRLDGVVVEGVVDDLRALLGKCRVGVCPVRIGAGMQNKLLDYMAHGVASVTSPIGLEGLDAVPDADLIVAESPTQWVEAVCRLLVDDALAKRIGQAGRALVERHPWPAALSSAMKALDELMDATAGSKAAT